MTLHEQALTDRASGRVLGDNLADYLIPVHAGMPEFDIAMIDEREPLACRRPSPTRSITRSAGGFAICLSASRI